MTIEAQDTAPDVALDGTDAPAGAADADAAWETIGEALGAELGALDGIEAPQPAAAETNPPADAQQQPDDPAEGDAPSRPKVVEPPKRWEQMRDERRARAAERRAAEEQAQQQQGELAQRLAALEAQLQAPRQPQAPLMPPQLAQALQGGTPLQQLQALAQASGQPIDRFIGEASAAMLRGELTQPPQQREAPQSRAGDPLVQQLVAKIAELEQRTQTLPDVVRQQYAQQQAEAALAEDFNALARIPMTDSHASRFPNIAATHPDVLRPRIYQMLVENQQLPPGERFTLTDIASALDNEFGALYAYRESRLSGTGTPAAPGPKIPALSANQTAAAQGQGNPAFLANPANNPTAVTNHDAATAGHYATEAEQIAAAERLLAGMSLGGSHES